MNYQEISFNIKQQDLEIVSDLLTELGSVAITEAAADKENVFQLSPDQQPKWDNITLTGLFNEDDNIEIIKQKITNYCKKNDLNTELMFYHKILKDTNWIENYKQYLQPIQFTKNLWVCPSWKQIPDPNSTNIILDPGQAFGTGTHETTSLCLEWIANNIQSNQIFIDYGCGSGILAITAAKLGAKQCYATDLDPKALEVSEENKLLNKLQENHLIILTPDNLTKKNIKADILIANILAAPLISLMDTFNDLLKTNGKIVLSGILQSQTDLIIENYRKNFKDFNIIGRNEWIRIEANKI